MRFEAGDVKEVNLIDYGGKRCVFDFNNKVNGFLDGKKAPKNDEETVFAKRETNQKLAKENK